jgi:hypothetical protein
VRNRLVRNGTSRLFEAGSKNPPRAHGRLRNWTLRKRQSSRSTTTIATKPGFEISFA